MIIVIDYFHATKILLRSKMKESGWGEQYNAGLQRETEREGKGIREKRRMRRIATNHRLKTRQPGTIMSRWSKIKIELFVRCKPH